MHNFPVLPLVIWAINRVNHWGSYSAHVLCHLSGGPDLLGVKVTAVVWLTLLLTSFASALIFCFFCCSVEREGNEERQLQWLLNATMCLNNYAQFAHAAGSPLVNLINNNYELHHCNNLLFNKINYSVNFTTYNQKIKIN